MLAGPRRIGKTSAAFEVLRMLEQRGCYTLRVDLLHVVSVENFALQVLKQVTTLRSGVVQTALEAIDPLMMTEEAFELAERIAKKDEKRLVFLLDEFQEVDRIGGTALLNALRTVFQQQENTVYLFLGSEPSMMKTIFADRRRAFYSFATILHLPEIESQEWRDYAEQKLTHWGMSFDPEAFQMILNVTGGHPHGVMTTLLNAFFETRQENVTAITVAHAYAALRQTLEQFDAIYEEFWKQILDIPKADEVLIALANGEPPYRGKSATVAKRAIDGLIKNSVIVKSARGRYRFVEPVFQRWIIENNVGQPQLWF